MKSCKNPAGCTNQLDDDQKFCDECGFVQPEGAPAATTTVVTQPATTQQPAAAVDPLVALAGQTVVPRSAPTTTVVTQPTAAAVQPQVVTTATIQAASGNRREPRSDRAERPRERRPLDEGDVRDMAARGRFDVTTLSALEIGFAAMGKQPLQRSAGQPAQGATSVPDTRVQSTPVPAAHAAYAPPGTAVAGQGQGAAPQQPQTPAFNPFVPPPAATNNPAPSSSVFCGECGAQNASGDSCCGECGANL